MPENLSRQLIAAHLVAGEMVLGTEIAVAIDQTLLQDSLGALVMLELEAMGIERVRTNPSVQYVDHGLVQHDEINADTHLFLKSACERFGIIYCGAGNGISHPVHMDRFGVPGQSLLGGDSHTPAAGSLGMLAIGAGGVEVALAMAGEPLYLTMPEIWGVELTGRLSDWVSAKDVILEMLRRHGVSGGVNTIIEYYGPGLDCLSAMDRHVIANMGAELGATSSVFPSDEMTRSFLRTRGREECWSPLRAEPGCQYDRHESIDLGSLEPLIARPSSPDNVVPVREAAGEPIYQAYIGSSANPGFRDFAMAAAIVDGQSVAGGVSLDINPSSRLVLDALVRENRLGSLIRAGARLHQAGCNGCIGMGQAPATGRNSLRTVPRNFPGRSGTREDSVFLCSPETAAASALTGAITDPRTLDIEYPVISEPLMRPTDVGFIFPDPASRPELLETKHTPKLPPFEAFPDTLEVPVLLTVGDDISTDAIIPAGPVLPLWSDVYESANYAFAPIDDTYPARARGTASTGGHAIIGGRNYGQGSSRENAALVPQLLGLRVVIAASFARIHWQNLVSFGVLPLSWAGPQNAVHLPLGTTVKITSLRAQIARGREITATAISTRGEEQELRLCHGMSERQTEILLTGGVINRVRTRN